IVARTSSACSPCLVRIFSATRELIFSSRTNSSLAMVGAYGPFRMVIRSMTMIGGFISGMLIVPLAIPGYMLGSWRWLRRTRNLWELTAILATFFFAWYVVLRVDGGPEALVPIAMGALAVGFGVGRYVYARQLRARRRESN